MPNRGTRRGASRRSSGGGAGLILAAVAVVAVIGAALVMSSGEEPKPRRTPEARAATATAPAPEPTPQPEPTPRVEPVAKAEPDVPHATAPDPEPQPQPAVEPEPAPEKPRRIPTATHADTLGYWRFEGPVGQGLGVRAASDTNPDALAGTVKGTDAGSITYDSEVPARYVYDPLTGKSSRNETSVRLRPNGNAGAYIEVPFDPDGGPTAGVTSWTLEMFVKPSADPRRTVYGGLKTRSSDAGCEAGVGANFLTRWKQTYFSGFYATADGKRDAFSTGSYVSISRINRKTIAWRHLAVVYDAEAKTVGAYLDHWQVARRAVPSPLRWDDAPFLIGGRDGDNAFDGLIDEVRLTKAALPPSRFLWARDDELADVQFDSVETVLPAATGYVDLKEGFGAVGDGVVDDTRAIRNAFAALANKIPLGFHTLYIPPGTYLVSDTCRWSRYLVVQGAGRDRTTIKLKDRCPGFTSPARKKSVIGASSTMGPGPERRCNGSSMDNNMFDLTIDTGTGNPGAVAFEYHTNNYGTIQNLTLRSGDGSGVAGLELLHNCCGPMLAKNVLIEGFDYGITMGRQEYSATFEHITLRNQKKAGVMNAGNIMAFRGVKSENAVPAFVDKGGNSMYAILDAEFKGGSPDEPAVMSSGSLYVRDLRTEGYTCAIEKRIGTQVKRGRKRTVTWETKVVDGPVVREFVGDRVVCLRGEGKGSLKLPIEEPPIVPLGDIHEDWANVRDFEHLAAKDDWTAAVQAAIDSGKQTVFFPWGGYPCKGTVHLRGSVRRLRGMKNGLGRPKGWKGDAPVLIYDNRDRRAVTVIEQLGCKGLKHASPGTLVLKHASWAPYTNARGCGKLFMENTTCNPMDFDHPQKVWVRHWNPESHDTSRPCIRSRGATIWSLGFKTEYESSKLWAEGGAKTEILGSFIYPIGKIPADRPIFKNTDSQMAVQYGTSVYSSNHKVHIIDVQRGDEKRADNDDLKWMGSRARMDLYTSHRFE